MEVIMFKVSIRFLCMVFMVVGCAQAADTSKVQAAAAASIASNATTTSTAVALAPTASR